MNSASKLALNCAEAMEYLSVRRRTFEAVFLPLLTPVRMGTSKLFEVSDLNSAWDQVKQSRASPNTVDAIPVPTQNGRRNGRPTSMKGEHTWAETHGASTPTKTVPGKLTSIGEARDFASAVSLVLAKRKAG
jgi:hypothetical protein